MAYLGAIWTILRISLCHAFGHLPDRHRDAGPAELDSDYRLVVSECPRCGGVSQIRALSPEAARRALEEES